MAIQEQISKLEAGSASYAEKTTVVGQPDVPGLSTREMQESVEYMPRNLLLPKLNEVVGAVNQCYTKAEADKAIAGKVTEIGAGDMAQAVYDPNGEGLNFTDLRNLLYPNAGAHNAVYRGKALGGSVSEEQYAAIKAGTFDDLYIGDYWTIGGVNYRIAAFDYFLNNGDTECTDHHAVIVPDTCLYKAQMNKSDTAEGGYVGTIMYKNNLEQAKTTIKAAFNGHILRHRIILSNAVRNDHVYGVIFCDSEVELMCEHMVYGSGIFLPANRPGYFAANYRNEKSQLPLFQHEPSRIVSSDTFWLRDIVNGGCFACVHSDGIAGVNNNSSSYGVRPYFCIY